MKRIIPICAFVIFFTLSHFSQTPPPLPNPAADDDVVKISTNLIRINATVTDKKGNAIRDLQPNDFELYQNGKKQEIIDVTFVGAGEDPAKTEKSAKSAKKEKIPTPVMRSEIKPEQIRRTIVLAVDDIHLSAESINYVRKSLRTFVDQQMQEGDLVAIIRMGGGIGALQQFTSDKTVLYAAIEKVRFNVLGSQGLTAFAPIEPDAMELANAGGLGASPLEQGRISSGLRDKMIRSERESIQRANDFRQNSYTTGTLGGLTYIIRGMRDLPGRKSIILLSDGFQLFSPRTDEFNQNAENNDLLKKLADSASRSSVVVYTIDARGLQTLAISAADNSQGTRSPNIGTVEELVNSRRAISFFTQEGLIAVAERTGGFASLNSNDLSGGIRKALDDQSYYLIAYQPDEEIFDPRKLKFNDLEVKVKRNNADVRYSTGFFGIADETIEKPIIPTPFQKISAALTSPFAANDITLNLNTVFRSDAKYNYFMNSFLYISIKDLKFTDEPDGMKKAVFDLLAVSFGDNGIPLDSISKKYTINIKAEKYQKLLSEGFVYNFTFPIKRSGMYQMRVAIRDHATEKIGSASQFIEVPKLDKKRLTLSGLVVENLSRELYEKGENSSLLNSKLKNPDALADTALRSFKRGTVMRYGFEIYNAKSSSLEIRTRVFREGELVFEGKPKPIEINRQSDTKIIKTSGAINIGEEMQTGDYILQIIVTDYLAKEKYNTASQFVEFEVFE